MCEFEAKVKAKIDKILGDSASHTPHPRVGLAVSGGADSISLLLSLSEIFSSIFVITINHNIRPEEESRGDAEFVVQVCEELKQRGHDIVCELVEFERGEVEKQAQSRGGGIEEAARYLRYSAFELFMAKYKLDILCLAHNQNDQLETLLMRFLQGSPAEAACGIKESRKTQSGQGIFARPLLGLSRAEIEAYVTSRGFTWRTDKTNYETDYLRNKIRLKLVPFLDESFPGWQKSILSGAERAAEDAELILSCVEKVPVSVGGGTEGDSGATVEIPLDLFLEKPQAVQRRVLLSACNKAGENTRIPALFIKEVLDLVTCKKEFTKHFAGIDILLKKNHLFVKKHAENNTDFVFSDIIEETGSFSFPFGTLNVFNCKEQNGKKTVSVSAGDFCECGENGLVENVSLPFCIRNTRTGDSVLCADGSEKKVSDIFSDWHVEPEKRYLIPVIQLLDEKSQRIKAVLAGFLGYKDWIVKL